MNDSKDFKAVVYQYAEDDPDWGCAFVIDGCYCGFFLGRIDDPVGKAISELAWVYVDYGGIGIEAILENFGFDNDGGTLCNELDITQRVKDFIAMVE